MGYVPPVSMPLTAASEIVRSTTFAASLTVSTGPLRTMGEVLNRRAWRAMAVRNIVIVCVVDRFERCDLGDSIGYLQVSRGEFEVRGEVGE